MVVVGRREGTSRSAWRPRSILHHQMFWVLFLCTVSWSGIWKEQQSQIVPFFWGIQLGFCR